MKKNYDFEVTSFSVDLWMELEERIGKEYILFFTLTEEIFDPCQRVLERNKDQ